MFQALLDELPPLQSLDCRNLPSGNRVWDFEPLIGADAPVAVLRVVALKSA
jgi:hypothetical protein